MEQNCKLRTFKTIGHRVSYILDCIWDSADVADGYVTLENDEDAVKAFFKCFEEEFNSEHTRARWPYKVERVSEYLKGLPSICNIDFYNDDIVKIGKQWNKCPNDSRTKVFINNWFNSNASLLVKLANHYNIKIK